MRSVFSRNFCPSARSSRWVLTCHLIYQMSLCRRQPIALVLPSLPVTVQFDRDDLNQVVITALRHILKCSSPDDVIHIDLSQREGQIRIQISNAECDQAQDQAQHTAGSITAFHPVDAHLVSSDQSDLWLVICKTIVECTTVVSRLLPPLTAGNTPVPLSFLHTRDDSLRLQAEGFWNGTGVSSHTNRSVHPHQRVRAQSN